MAKWAELLNLFIDLTGSKLSAYALLFFIAAYLLALGIFAGIGINHLVNGA